MKIDVLKFLSDGNVLPFGSNLALQNISVLTNAEGTTLGKMKFQSLHFSTVFFVMLCYVF